MKFTPTLTASILLFATAALSAPIDNNSVWARDAARSEVQPEGKRDMSWVGAEADFDASGKFAPLAVRDRPVGDFPPPTGPTRPVKRERPVGDFPQPSGTTRPVKREMPEKRDAEAMKAEPQPEGFQRDSEVEKEMKAEPQPEG